MRVLNPRPGDFFLALSPLDQHAKGQSAQAEIKRYMASMAMQYDLRYRRLSRPQVVDGRVVTKSFQRKSGPDARNGGRSSRAGAVRMGPSALYRRTGTVRSSVRSPHIVGSQRSEPRRHHCRPAVRFGAIWHALRDQSGRMPSLGVAHQRIWLV